MRVQGMGRISEYRSAFRDCSRENSSEWERQMMPVHCPVADDRVNELPGRDAANDVINLVQGRGRRRVQVCPDDGVDLIAAEVG